MAKTGKERMREYRERRKEKEQRKVMVILKFNRFLKPWPAASKAGASRKSTNREHEEPE